LREANADKRRELVYEHVGPHGPDLVVEAAGVLGAFPEGVELTGNHARYLILGLWGATGEVPISPRNLTLKNMTIQGATFPKPKHYYGAVQLAARVQDRYPLAELVTHRFGIRDATHALAAVEAGKAVKAVIDPTL